MELDDAGNGAVFNAGDVLMPLAELQEAAEKVNGLFDRCTFGGKKHLTVIVHVADAGRHHKDWENAIVTFKRCNQCKLQLTNYTL